MQLTNVSVTGDESQIEESVPNETSSAPYPVNLCINTSYFSGGNTAAEELLLKPDPDDVNTVQDHTNNDIPQAPSIRCVENSMLRNLSEDVANSGIPLIDSGVSVLSNSTVDTAAKNTLKCEPDTEIPWHIVSVKSELDTNVQYMSQTQTDIGLQSTSLFKTDTELRSTSQDMVNMGILNTLKSESESDAEMEINMQSTCDSENDAEMQITHIEHPYYKRPYSESPNNALGSSDTQNSKHDNPEHSKTQKNNPVNHPEGGSIAGSVKPFKCKFCQKSFRYLGMLKNHTLLHNMKGTDQYSCRICNKTFRFIKELKIHSIQPCSDVSICYACDTDRCKKTAGCVKPFKCKFCQKSFKYLGRLKNHTLLHNMEGNDQYACRLCYTTFRLITQLERHAMQPCSDISKRYARNTTAFKKTSQKFVCDQCGKGFQRAQDLERHKRSQCYANATQHLCTFCAKSFGCEEDLQSHETLLCEKRYNRETCKQRYGSEKDLQRDEALSCAKRYNCRKCGESFECDKAFTRHEMLCMKRFECEMCRKCFESYKELIQHEALHEALPSEKRYNCQKCGDSFKDESDLIRHKILLCMKLFRCKKCRKCFGSDKALIQHNMLPCVYSVGDFTCTQCGEQCRSENQLKVHVCGQHLQACSERQFKCKKCKKAFKSEECLQKHEMIHVKRKQFTCKKCEKNFKSVEDLNEHRQQHNPYSRPFKNHRRTDKKRFICNKCPQRFETEGALREHKMIHVQQRKKFTCYARGCRKHFENSKGLTLHKVLVHRRHKCRYDGCNNLFRTLQHLEVHEQVVHVATKPIDKLHKCRYDGCKYHFKTRQSLKLHERSIHIRHNLKDHHRKDSVKKPVMPRDKVVPMHYTVTADMLKHSCSQSHVPKLHGNIQDSTSANRDTQKTIAGENLTTTNMSKNMASESLNRDKTQDCSVWNGSMGCSVINAENVTGTQKQAQDIQAKSVVSPEDKKREMKEYQENIVALMHSDKEGNQTEIRKKHQNQDQRGGKPVKVLIVIKNGKAFQCRECSYSASNLQLLLSHYREIHSKRLHADHYKEQHSGKQNTDSTCCVDNTSVYQCPECRQYFASKVRLSKHHEESHRYGEEGKNSDTENPEQHAKPPSMVEQNVQVTTPQNVSPSQHAVVHTAISQHSGSQSNPTAQNRARHNTVTVQGAVQNTSVQNKAEDTAVHNLAEQNTVWQNPAGKNTTAQKSAVQNTSLNNVVKLDCHPTLMKVLVVQKEKPEMNRQILLVKPKPQNVGCQSAASSESVIAQVVDSKHILGSPITTILSNGETTQNQDQRNERNVNQGAKPKITSEIQSNHEEEQRKHKKRKRVNKKKTEKPFQCSVCGLCFTHKGLLIGHSRSHTGERPFQCDECGMRYSYASCLRIHKKTHAAVKPFMCEVCGKGFVFRCNLNAHIRTHTGEKPYKCKVCEIYFRSATDLNKHSQKHEVANNTALTNSNTCENEASKAMAISQIGISSDRQNTGEEKEGTSNFVVIKEKHFECKTCGKKFKKERGRNLHETRVHMKEFITNTELHK